MRIIDATWTRGGNILHIHCDCGRRFQTRADRWKVKCGACRRLSHLGVLRDKWQKEQ